MGGLPVVAIPSGAAALTVPAEGWSQGHRAPRVSVSLDLVYQILI